MPLVRRLARPALAATFITSGLHAVRHPDALAPDAEPVAARLTATLKRVLPPQASAAVPTDTVKLVRINGGIQLAGGLLLALGKAPRLSAFALAASLVPSTVAQHAFWSDSEPAAKAEDRTQFVRNIGLLGGLLLAAVDTAGRPGLTWRAKRASRDVKRQAKHARGSARLARSAARSKVGAATATVSDALPFG